MEEVKRYKQRAILSKYRYIYHRLKSDKIIFADDGFEHFSYSRYGKRKFGKTLKRVSFIPQIPKILETCPEPTEIRGDRKLRKGKIKQICYYAYEMSTPSGVLRLVTQKTLAAPKPRFLSLFIVE